MNNFLNNLYNISRNGGSYSSSNANMSNFETAASNWETGWNGSGTTLNNSSLNNVGLPGSASQGNNMLSTIFALLENLLQGSQNSCNPTPVTCPPPAVSCSGSTISSGSSSSSTPSSSSLSSTSQSSDSSVPGESARAASIHGDPYVDNASGQQVQDQMAAGDYTLLKNNTDGASITSEIDSSDNSLVIGKTVFNLGNNVRVEYDADGSAKLIDSQGNVQSNLTQGQTVTGANGNTVTFTTGIAGLPTLNYTLKDNAGDSVSGFAMRSASGVDGTNVTINSGSTGSTFSGLLPSLNSTFNTKQYPETPDGSGIFTDDPATGTQRNNASFTANSLYDN